MSSTATAPSLPRHTPLMLETILGSRGRCAKPPRRAQARTTALPLKIESPRQSFVIESKNALDVVQLSLSDACAVGYKVDQARPCVERALLSQEDVVRIA